MASPPPELAQSKPAQEKLSLFCFDLVFWFFCFFVFRLSMETQPLKVIVLKLMLPKKNNKMHLGGFQEIDKAARKEDFILNIFPSCPLGTMTSL